MLLGMEVSPEDAGGGGVTITNLLLGVVNWWCLKQGKMEVVNLVKRHFNDEEVYKSNLILAEECDLPKPGRHKVSATRPAIDAYADDLVTNMKNLVNSDKVPKIVIPAAELGKVPLDTLSISDERSVGARLESLEQSVKSVVATVEKLSASNLALPVISPVHGLTVPSA